jgi:hypothetical protein
MRWVFAAMALAIAGVAAAQPVRHYDLYIFDPGNDGAELYAIAAGSRAVALEVRGCGDVSLLDDPRAVVADLRARREWDEDNTFVVITGRNSRTELGPCGENEPEAEDDDEPSLVIIENMSASQARRTLRTLDAAPESVREQMLDAVGL